MLHSLQHLSLPLQLNQISLSEAMFLHPLRPLYSYPTEPRPVPWGQSYSQSRRHHETAHPTIGLEKTLTYATKEPHGEEVFRMSDAKELCTADRADKKTRPPGKLKLLFLNLYSPSGELSRREYVECFALLAMVRIFACALFIILIFLLGFLGVNLRGIGIPVVVFGTIEVMMDLSTLIYPYVNIATKRLRHIGVQSTYLFFHVLAVVISLNVVMYFSRYDYLGHILYSIPAVCLFFTWRGR